MYVKLETLLKNETINEAILSSCKANLRATSKIKIDARECYVLRKVEQIDSLLKASFLGKAEIHIVAPSSKVESFEDLHPTRRQEGEEGEEGGGSFLNLRFIKDTNFEDAVKPLNKKRRAFTVIGNPTPRKPPALTPPPLAVVHHTPPAAPAAPVAPVAPVAPAAPAAPAAPVAPVAPAAPTPPAPPAAQAPVPHPAQTYRRSDDYDASSLASSQKRSTTFSRLSKRPTSLRANSTFSQRHR